VSPLGAAALFISPEAFQERPLWQELGGALRRQQEVVCRGQEGSWEGYLEGSFGRSREGSFAGVKRDPSSWSGEILRLGQERSFAEVRKDPSRGWDESLAEVRKDSSRGWDKSFAEVKKVSSRGSGFLAGVFNSGSISS
jgi:hypothetical protein